MEAQKINSQLIKLLKRAETNESETIIKTFVDVGSIEDILSNKNSQIIYGRRGTGKTHALIYLASIVRNKGEISIYIDMRNLGSNNSFYNSNKPPEKRATVLLRDALTKIHGELLSILVQYEEQYDLSAIIPVMDQLADAIAEVRVEGPVQIENANETNSGIKNTGKISGSLTKADISFEFGGENNLSEKNALKSSYSGQVVNRVDFGNIGRIFAEIARFLKGRTIWVIFDEWSSIKSDLQPYLADVIKRTLLPIRGFVIKIAAIEQRSSFRIGDSKDYIGFELGADITADFALDDFMVYERGNERAIGFFKKLLFKHLISSDDVEIANENDFVNAAFTQHAVFDELVRASEGVPRDAMSIISIAAQRAYDQKISMSHIRNAARDWYLRDKEADLKEQPNVYKLLHWIIDKVIGSRKAKAFLLRNDSKHELIDTLFDARVIHILKKNISARDKPGVRYDSYKLDYGCYVDLITTKRAPQAILPLFYEEFKNDEFELKDIPMDDYRAIRRAILNIDEFVDRRRIKMND